ncbi:RNA-guided endonuclease InsQ/TnpB family protein [Clostridium tetani]|uniref:RNA-guided endonuclease InsQ/TnpB family protein n=1 Tax=Clostridium tetani TaxID=1513 RepID=UPI0005138ED4|nr:RNA-guided endonuclease TnpB family protein [Clostridium tetani]KGI41285.1 transposase [Clostridium tetani]RXI75106.1 transposase [Clostridium tetani]BDR76012.1 transposase [Clostridium tetani]BDR76973.1 transposase [Clostridium tetani]BDR87129.1 transposase [Clostridium tetani]
MIKALNIRLYPTQEQATLMYKHIGCMRFVYNWALARQIDSYKHSGKKLSIAELGKELTVLKNTEGYEWLYEVSNATLKEGIRDLDKAYGNFFKGRGFPKFKSKKKSEPKFYSRYEKIYFKDNLVNLEKIGKVKCKVDYDIDLTTIKKFKNPRVKFNGRVWVLSVGIEIPAKKVKKLNKKLKKLQRQCSKKYIINKKGGSYQKTKNIGKLELKIKKLHSKLKNIRLNHTHQTTSKMVKAKPYRVVMEDLKVSNMIKNKHLSKAISEQGFNIFINQMKYKCQKYGIEFIQVPTFYPSSKTCSHCGTIKKDLKLSDRTYKCDCGFTCDRDKNASYNLANYGLEISI